MTHGEEEEEEEEEEEFVVMKHRRHISGPASSATCSATPFW
jgi:hypothetical protein